MILDSAGFALEEIKGLPRLNTQATPNYSMKSKAATHNRDLREWATLNYWKAPTFPNFSRQQGLLALEGRACE